MCFPVYWLYSWCTEVKHIPPPFSQALKLSQLPSDCIMLCGSTLLLFRLLFQLKNECLWEMRVCRICPDVCLCQIVAPVFPCIQSFYQTCNDGLGFVLSTWQMICDWGRLGAPNMLMLQQRQSLSDLFRIYSIYLSITWRALIPHQLDVSC